MRNTITFLDRELWRPSCPSEPRSCLLWVVHVIPATPVSPVCTKSGHSANARVCQYAPCGAAEDKSLEIKPESWAGGRFRCSLCPACAPSAPGAALLGTARW